jgi:D-amino-acid dehydrogenase
MHVLHRDALAHYEPLLEGTEAGQLMRRNGSLVLSERQGGATPTALAQELQHSFGIRFEFLDAQALRDLDPGLPASALHGQYFPDNAHCDDSFKLVQLLARKAAERGAELVQAEARGFEYADGRPSALRTDKGPLAVDRLLIAAGIWSAPLARQLGSRLPLQAERGYHVHLPTPEIRLPRIPFRHKERSFAVTPMGGGIRFAGTAELASVEAAPDWRRSDRLAELGAGLFPGVSQAGATRWMGSRPSFPDGLPVLGRSPRHANVFFAFGSSHFGLTEAPTMARVIAELVSGHTPAIDLAPFAPTRF